MSWDDAKLLSDRAKGMTWEECGRNQGKTVDQARRRGKQLRESPSTVATLPRLPEPAEEAGGPGLPDPVEMSYDAYLVDGPFTAGVLCDPHFPYHDKRT